MTLREQAYNAAAEIIETAGLKKGQILVVGCSTSEILGAKIGTDSSPDTAKEVFDGIYAAANNKGIYIAAQCCEHLNRAVICERAAGALQRDRKCCAVSEGRRLVCDSGIRGVLRSRGA